MFLGYRRDISFLASASMVESYNQVFAYKGAHEVITAIMIIMAITVIGTTEVVLLVTQAGGVIVDRMAILVTAVMA
jgi:hypothetical protein